MKQVLFLLLTLGLTSHAQTVLDYADPFYGQAGVDLPPPQGIAAAWNWEKAQAGNTHPGPQLPFGMVSVVPYTKAYPTGTGYNKKTTKGPARYQEKLRDAAFGFTHFQQTGTGAILSYYNFLRTIPVDGYSKKNREALYKLSEIEASPGYYAATIIESGVRAEITTSTKVAYHRYTLPSSMSTPQLLIELTSAGIGKESEKVHYLESEELGRGMIGGMFEDQGFPYYYVIEVSGAVRVAISARAMIVSKFRMRKPRSLRTRSDASRIHSLSTT